MKDHRISSPRLEHSKESDLIGSQPLWNGQQVLNRCRPGCEDRFVSFRRTGAQQPPQFLGHGKCHKEMMNRQQAIALLLQPGLSLLMLTVRTMPIAA